jgi:GxxExxY protein
MNMAELVLKDLSYQIMGLLFKVHNQSGPICKERNYQDAIELIFKKERIYYQREKELELPFDGSKLKGFYADFVINNKVILEIKASRFIKNEDICQVSRYIKAARVPLGIIVNFKRNKLEYKRVINSEFKHQTD